ncbi:MAG: DUF177 domain-containing protein [bacterium]|nr:DUF177 domain-containing protein [bacterium]
MTLDISDVFSLENKEVTRKVHIDMETFQSRQGEFPIQSGEPFDLQIVNVEGKRLQLSGETRVTVQIPCDRCLQEVTHNISIEIEKEVPIKTDDTQQTEDDDEAEAYIEDGILDVDRLVYNEILVNWPAKILCKSDCKGICPKCGANLNLTTCDCEQGELDPRMAQFQDVFNKFKEV